MKIKALLFFAVFAIAFSQQAYDDNWIESGQMIRFPTSKYFTAIGIGSSEKKASENAFVEIRKQISATIKSEQILSEFSLTTENSQKDTSILNMKSKISVVGDVTGVEIIATSKRENNFYAFAALEKEKFISLQKMKITELQNDLITTNNLANTAIKEQKIALAILLLNSAKEKISAIQNERLLLSAAAALTENERIPVSKAEIDGKLAQILNSIRIVEIEPFSVKITANNLAVENLPVSLFDEKNKKIATKNSDVDGIINFVLGENVPTLRGTYKYTIKIDITGIHAQVLPVIQFSYSVKPLDLPAKISISVSPELKNGLLTIEKSANEMLSNHGILSDKNACIKISVLISDTPKETIDGVSASKNFVRSLVLAQILVTDKKGKQLYSTTTSNLGTGKDRNTAVGDGIRKIKLGTILSDIQSIVENCK